jgi:hypothetical protein
MCRNSTFTLGSKKGSSLLLLTHTFVMWKYNCDNCEPLWQRQGGGVVWVKLLSLSYYHSLYYQTHYNTSFNLHITATVLYFLAEKRHLMA